MLFTKHLTSLLLMISPLWICAGLFRIQQEIESDRLESIDTFGASTAAEVGSGMQILFWGGGYLIVCAVLLIILVVLYRQSSEAVRQLEETQALETDGDQMYMLSVLLLVLLVVVASALIILFAPQGLGSNVFQEF